MAADRSGRRRHGAVSVCGGALLSACLSSPSRDAIPDTIDAGIADTIDATPSGAISDYELFYSFDDGGGASVVHDRSGHRRDGKFVGATSSDGSGRYGGGFQFDATHHVVIPTYRMLGFGSALTIEAWLKPQATAAQVIFGDRQANGVNLSLELTADNSLRLVTNDQGATVAVDGKASQVPIGFWTHIAVTWDGTTARFYLDGRLVDGEPFAPKPMAEPGLRLGVGFAPGAGAIDAPPPFVGGVDELKLSKVVRSAAEIASSRTHDSSQDLGRCGDLLIETPEACEGGADLDLCCATSTCGYLPDGTTCADGTCAAGVCKVASTGRVTSGLLALYAFDDGVGSAKVADSATQNEPELTIADPNAVVWHTGYLDLISTTEIQPATASAFDVTSIAASGEITVEAWIRPAVATPSTLLYVATLSNVATERFQLAQLGSSYLASVFAADAPWLDAPTVGPALTPGVTHVVFTRSTNGDRRLYLDGHLRGQQSPIVGDLTTWPPKLDLILGNRRSGVDGWTGELHLIAIYSRALTAAEVAQNFAAGPD